MQIIECPICLQPVINQIITHCNHRFCDICIMSHFIIKNTCPICRGVCNYNQILQQIKPCREKIIIQKLTESQVSINPYFVSSETQYSESHSEDSMPINMHVPMFMPISSLVRFIFILEVCVIIYVIFYIVQKVNCMYNEENK